jgi:hypothetical protein
MLGRQGRDSTGAVLVRLGHDRLPGWIWIDPDWLDLLRPEDFCDAVLAAARDAADDEWHAATGDGGADEWLEPATARTVDPEQAPWLGTAAYRRPDAIVEDLLRAYGYAADLPASAYVPPSGTGLAHNGELTVTVSEDGLRSCAARPDWVAECRAATLVDALGSALTAARADLARAPRRPDLAGRLDALHAELRVATRAAARTN